MFERFTERARQVIVLAQDEARALKHNYIGTEHILLGLLREEEGVAAHVLESLDVDIEGVRAQVANIVGPGDEPVTGQIPFTPRAKKVLELALREALNLAHNYVGAEHILLGLVRENEGVAARVLLDFDADPEKVRAAVTRVLSGPGRKAQAIAPTRTRARARFRVDLAAALDDAKEFMISKSDFEEAARLRDQQRRLHLMISEVEDNLARLAKEHQLPVRNPGGARWEYDVRTIEGATDTWVAQLMAWRNDGWELLTIVEEGDQRRALLERRVP